MNSKELMSQYNSGKRDFVAVNLSDSWLSWANLPEINFHQACLKLSILEGVNLIGSNLTEANLIRVDLTLANLAHANLQRANLENADLRGADLSYANLTDANLKGVNLTGADLNHTILPKNYILPNKSPILNNVAPHKIFLALSGFMK